MSEIEESAMAKASTPTALPWEWIVEKLVDNKDISTPLIKAMISVHIPDINNSSSSNLQGRIALRYLEEVLLLDRLEAHVIPLLKVLLNSSIPNSSSAADQALLLRVCTEVVLGHTREIDENGERDWEGFEDDLNRIFTEEDSSLPFVNRRKELLQLFEDKTTCLSMLMKYPVETLKYDLRQFVRVKKACLNRTVLDQLVYDVSKGRHFPSLLHDTHPSPTGEGTNSGGRKRLYGESDLPYEHTSSEGEKRLKHGQKDCSTSNTEKTREHIIEKPYNGSENGCQNNSLCTSTGNLQEDTQTATGNGFLDIGTKLEIHIIGDEKILQVSSGTESTSNVHSHCSERRDEGVCCLEGEPDEPKEKNNSEATSTREHHSLEAEELPELDLLIPGNDGLEQICFRCREGGVLSCCDGCSIAMHDKCFKLSASAIPGETFDCHVCSYKRALAVYQKAKKDAIESKKRLLAFLNIRSVQGNEQRSRNSNHKKCEKGVKAFANKMKISEEPSSHTRDFTIGSKRKQHLCSKSSGTNVYENKRPDGIENDIHCKQNEADNGMHSGDLEDGKSEDRKYHLRNRKSTMRGTCRLPGARRNILTWTKAEEKALKEGMQNILIAETNGIPWKRILEQGKGIFDKSRLPTDLKDKWRNMKKANS